MNVFVCVSVYLVVLHYCIRIKTRQVKVRAIVFLSSRIQLKNLALKINNAVAIEHKSVFDKLSTIALVSIILRCCLGAAAATAAAIVIRHCQFSKWKKCFFYAHHCILSIFQSNIFLTHQFSVPSSNSYSVFIAEQGTNNQVSKINYLKMEKNIFLLFHSIAL